MCLREFGGNALKRSPGIIRKSRVSYPGPGFLSSATWPSLPKKHYNGLNQPNQKFENKHSVYKKSRRRFLHLSSFSDSNSFMMVGPEPEYLNCFRSGFT